MSCRVSRRILAPCRWWSAGSATICGRFYPDQARRRNASNSPIRNLERGRRDAANAHLVTGSTAAGVRRTPSDDSVVAAIAELKARAGAAVQSVPVHGRGDRKHVARSVFEQCRVERTTGLSVRGRITVSPARVRGSVDQTAAATQVSAFFNGSGAIRMILHYATLCARRRRGRFLIGSELKALSAPAAMPPPIPRSPR